MNWRENQGVEGKSYIMLLIKEEWRNKKPSILRYQRELRGGLGEGWIQNLRAELNLERKSGRRRKRRGDQEDREREDKKS